VELVLAEGMGRAALQQLASTCHLAVDQVMAGVYGTFAAEMMAAGLPVVARIAPALRAAYPEDLPVIDATADTLASVLEAAANGGIDLASAGADSRAYARRLHDHHAVARQISALY
jgi:DNA-binding transcriptional LysR family regulator